MTQCKRCHSCAINPSQHGRDGTRLDLCDVCFWRNVAEERANRIARLEEAGDAMCEDYEMVAMDTFERKHIANWRAAKEAKP